MQFNIHNRLFSFDGKNINFYQGHPNGDLYIANEQFEKLEKNNLNVTSDTAFISKEHATVGDIAFEIFFNRISLNHQKIIKQKLKQTGLVNFRKTSIEGIERLFVDLTVGSQKIRAGMIVALAGYFALPDQPIAYDVTSNAKKILTLAELNKRFLCAFQTLVKDEKKEVPQIVKQISWEGKTIHGLIKNKAMPSIVMGAVHQEKITWANLTSRSLRWKKHIPGGFFISSYLQAAIMNFDHFGLEAATAYKTGHHLALQIAAEASELSDKNANKWQKLVEAFSLELFSCHFLADLFVSGHTRTPRKNVFEMLNNNRFIKKKWIAALFANLMHDEDNEKGVYICSENHPIPWEAMGDYRYSDSAADDQGEVHAQHAIAARLEELYRVFYKKANWVTIANDFTKDIPKEATPEWLDYCKCNDAKARTRALAHAHKFQPFLKVGINNQLQVRSDYHSLTNKKAMLILADELAKGIASEIKEIIPGTVKEIARIKPLSTKNNLPIKKTPEFNDPGQLRFKYCNEFGKDPLRRKILEELYLMDEADEVIVGIETPAVTKFDVGLP